MSLFTRNLNKYGKAILIQDRNESIINGGVVEVFSNDRNDKAIVKTLRGVTVFDGTNTERVATHKLSLDWRSDVAAEQWVTLKGKLIKILTAENCCENDDVLILMCTERGENSKVVNTA